MLTKTRYTILSCIKYKDSINNPRSMASEQQKIKSWCHGLKMDQFGKGGNGMDMS